MKELVKNIIERVTGHKVISAKGSQHMSDYIDVLERMISSYQVHGTGIACVVFSRNRAIQLYALIKSYFKYVTHPCDVYVLYCADSAEQKASYEYLKEIIKKEGWPVDLIEEKGFRADLISLLERLDTRDVFFLVDDIVFIRQMDLEDLTDIDKRVAIPSLRLGKNINYSYAHKHAQKVPLLTPEGPQFFTWTWAEGEYDWKYPLSVDGNIFFREEILALIRNVSFKAPNTLEKALQICQPMFLKRKGIVYDKPRIVNNPCNRVQMEIENYSGDVSPEFLLEKWMAGYEIDIDMYDDIATNSVHQELTLTFKKREVGI